MLDLLFHVLSFALSEETYLVWWGGVRGGNLHLDKALYILLLWFVYRFVYIFIKCLSFHKCLAYSSETWQCY